MKNNIIQFLVRNGMSILRGLRMTKDQHFSFREQVLFIGVLITAFILNLIFQPYGDFSELFWGFLAWVFITNGMVFAIREYLIYRKESEYRKRVSSLGHHLYNLDKTKPEIIEVQEEIPTCHKTNDEAYLQYKNDLNRLKEGIQPHTTTDIVSEISVMDELKPLKEVLSTASYKVNDVFGCPHYQVKLELEDWLMKNTLPVIDSANQKLEFLKKALEELKNARMAIKTGVEGEMMVLDYLEDFKDTLLPLNGIRFQSDKGTVENDVLLFTEQGIFSLEIKNIGANGYKVVKISKDGLWYDKGYHDWIRSDKDKIFDQVNRHTALTERLIGESFGFKDKYQVKSMIVIPNKNLEIENESIFNIVRPNQIVPLIREMPKVLTREECLELQKFFISKDIGQAKFEHLDSGKLVSEILRVFESLVQDCEFLKSTYLIQETYVEHVTNNNIGKYLRWKYLNYNSTRSVI